MLVGNLRRGIGDERTNKALFSERINDDVLYLEMLVSNL
jgi:hypothetical protein